MFHSVSLIEKVERMHECFPYHLRMGTAIMKEEKETEGKQKRVKMYSENVLK